MYSDNKHYGDAGSVGEELLLNVSELEQRVQVADKAIEEGYFTLDKALSFYGVSAREYIAYLLLKNKKKSDTQQKQMLEMLSIIVKVYHGLSSQFDLKGKKIMHDLEAFANEFS